MQVAQSSGAPTDPLIEALKLMSDPVKFKEHVKTLEDARKKFNKAKKEHDNAAHVARTVEQADQYAMDRKKAIDELEAKRNGIDKARQAKIAAQEMSMTRREGAHQIVVKEHEAANTMIRDDAIKLNRSLIQREATLERGNKQLAQDNAALKTAQDDLGERRARLAQALKN